ncbi:MULTISPECIES: phosphatidylglycerophosphatase A [Psychrobacter]|uniref:phosphatidylglycerophosphatase A family protein n=1 Tax=Psychrobacter TaxID=497 RepID=UPI00146A9BBF|nr:MULTISPECIES: phosphatidylglycerophosphatase A [Psychrobacter]
MSDELTKPDIRQANDCPPLPKDASALDTAVYWLALGLGSGLPRHAPGTWGTVGGLIAGVILMALGFVPFLMLTILSCVIGVWFCGRTSEMMGVHDDPHIVWDEWSGIWITLLPLSYLLTFQNAMLGSYWQNILQPFSLVALIAAFVLFRFFDILKPPPIAWADKKVAGGLGIMLDDIIAGVMAAATWVIIYNVIFYIAK